MQAVLWAGMMARGL